MVIKFLCENIKSRKNVENENDTTKNLKKRNILFSRFGQRTACVMTEVKGRRSHVTYFD